MNSKTEESGLTRGVSEHEKILLQITKNVTTHFMELEGFSEPPISSVLHECILLCRLVDSAILPSLVKYNFRAYIRGPFSEELRADLESLKTKGLIEVNKGRLRVSAGGGELLKSLDQDPALEETRRLSNKILARFHSPHSITREVINLPNVNNTPFGQLISISLAAHRG